MRDLVSGVLGVPAACLCAGGPGIVLVTLVSRARATEERPGIRWGHLGFGLGMTLAGVLLFGLAIAVAAG